MESKHFKIQDLAESDRPREKLLSQGARSLTDTELIAVLIGSGTTKHSALDIARQMLSCYNNRLDELSRATLRELMRFDGMGKVRAIGIVAALELGRRRSLLEAKSDIKIIHNSRDAYLHFRPFMADERLECVMIALLSSADEVLQVVPISEGSIAKVPIDVRKICETALLSRATRLILAHNHPSGFLEPSKEDCDATERLYEALKMFDIKLCDHIIVGPNSYYSFADHSLL